MSRCAAEPKVLQNLFKKLYYSDLNGGILEAFGSQTFLFKD